MRHLFGFHKRHNTRALNPLKLFLGKTILSDILDKIILSMISVLNYWVLRLRFAHSITFSFPSSISPFERVDRVKIIGRRYTHQHIRENRKFLFFPPEYDTWFDNPWSQLRHIFQNDTNNRRNHNAGVSFQFLLRLLFLSMFSFSHPPFPSLTDERVDRCYQTRYILHHPFLDFIFDTLMGYWKTFHRPLQQSSPPPQVVFKTWWLFSSW